MNVGESGAWRCSPSAVSASCRASARDKPASTGTPSWVRSSSSFLVGQDAQEADFKWIRELLRDTAGDGGKASSSESDITASGYVLNDIVLGDEI